MAKADDVLKQLTDDDVIDIRKFTLTINPKSFRSYSKETEEYTEQSIYLSNSGFSIIKFSIKFLKIYM